MHFKLMLRSDESTEDESEDSEESSSEQFGAVSKDGRHDEEQDVIQEGKNSVTAI